MDTIQINRYKACGPGLGRYQTRCLCSGAQIILHAIRLYPRRVDKVNEWIHSAPDRFGSPSPLCSSDPGPIVYAYTLDIIPRKPNRAGKVP